MTKGPYQTACPECASLEVTCRGSGSWDVVDPSWEFEEVDDLVCEDCSEEFNRNDALRATKRKA